MEKPLDLLFLVGVVVLIFLFLSAMISIFTIWKLSFFAAKTGAEIGDTLYEYYLKKDFLYHSRTNSAQLTKQIATEVSRVTDHVLQPLVQINARIIAVLFVSLVIFLYNPVIALSGLFLFFVCYYTLFIIVRGRLAKNGTEISRVSKDRFRLMNEGFGAIKDIQLLGRENNFINQFKESGEVFSEAYGSSNGLYNTPRYLMEFVVYSGMIGLVLILVKTAEGDLSQILPVLAVFGIAAFKLLPSFQQIYGSAAQIRSNLSAFYAIKNDLIKARESEKLIPSCSGKIKQLHESVRIENIFFKYEGKEKNAVDGISLEIPSRHLIGIVGASGSGKSTLLDILLGFIVPHSGNIFIGDTKIDATNLRSWQEKIGYVPQSIFLKDCDVIGNVAFGLDSSQIDMTRVKNAIKLAQLEDWIALLPDGLRTNVGERGVQLSGGQRQRIGIARALYNDVDFLFFDEATSALDGVTENMILKSIDAIGHSKTIVMIAHRLNTVKKCDLIYMIDEGKIVDRGTYDHLMENNSYFKNMANGITHDNLK